MDTSIKIDCRPLPSKRIKDLRGKIFGRLTVVSYGYYLKKTETTFWHCVCTCGVEKDIRAADISSGKTRSCGCYKHDVQTSKAVSEARKIHGLRYHYIYHIWTSIKQRCSNPNDKDYKRYGARGIYLHADWFNSVENFYKYIGDRPTKDYTIDRIDNDKGYEPGNVRWATIKEQNNNSRGCVRITYKGQAKTISQWAEAVGLKYHTLYKRIQKHHWSIEEALTRKVIK